MPAKKRRREEYWARINRAVDHIELHLQDEVTLEEIARAAFLSRCHFHRVFSGGSSSGPDP